MKRTRSILAAILAAAMTLTMFVALTGCNSKKNVYTIGICQLATHPALDDATKGFQDAVIKAFGEDGVVFDLQNAAGDSPMCSTIINSFVSKKVDLIMANATDSLQAAYNATSTIPILGTSVTEYGSALHIQDFNGTVGGNISGTSDLAPLTEQGDMILELFPEATKIGLIYCSAEANSEYQIKVMEEYLTQKGLQCTRYSFSDSNDIAAVATKAATNSDVIYVPTDNTAATCSQTIGNIVRTQKVPVVAGEAGICSGCGVATLSISYYDLGYKTGEMAVKVLRGEAKISEMPIEYVSAVKKYNPPFCEELDIQVPEGYEPLQ